MGTQLGERIAEALKQRGMTQKQLATLVNIKEAGISRYISGERRPKPEVLADIATALHTTSDNLLGIEPKGYKHAETCLILSRNASKMSAEEKRELINAILGGE